jgi:ClpP class serine protease
MKPSQILLEIGRNHWAITEDALEGVVRAVNRDLKPEDYHIFHAAKTEEREFVATVAGDKVDGTLYSRQSGNTGFLFIEGPITPRATMFSEISGLVSLDRLSAELAAFEKDESISRVIMVIDSPGGSVTGVSEFAQQVKGFSKPILSYGYGLVASAAYWIASAADAMIVSNTAIVGSIGVVSTIYVGKDDDGYIEIVSSQSPDKRVDPSSDEGRAKIQTILDDLASVFIQTVADNRKTTYENVMKNYGRGGVKVAAPALESGMVDGIGTLESLSTSAQGNNFRAENIFDNNVNIAESGIEPDGEQEQEEMSNDLTTQISDETAARAEGSETNDEAVEMTARLEKVEMYITSDAYPANIKAIAFEVIKGKKSIEYLEGMVTGYDAAKASAVVAATAEQEVETTPAEKPTASSMGVTGIAASEEDYQKMISGDRAFLGLPARKEMVN